LPTSELLERTIERLPGGETAAWGTASPYVAGLNSNRERARDTRLTGERNLPLLAFAASSFVVGAALMRSSSRVVSRFAGLSALSLSLSPACSRHRA